MSKNFSRAFVLSLSCLLAAQAASAQEAGSSDVAPPAVIVEAQAEPVAAPSPVAPVAELPVADAPAPSVPGLTLEQLDTIVQHRDVLSAMTDEQAREAARRAIELQEANTAQAATADAALAASAEPRDAEGLTASERAYYQSIIDEEHRQNERVRLALSEPLKLREPILRANSVKPVGLQAGYGTVSGEGHGPGGALELKLRNTQLNAAVQTTVDSHGPNVPRASASISSIRGRTVQFDSFNAGVSGYGYLGYDRNTAMDRRGGGRGALGYEWIAGNENFRVEFDSEGAAGVRDSKGKVIPYLEWRETGLFEACAVLSSKDKACADVWGAVSVGLIQAEAAGGAGLSYQRRISQDGDKLFIRGGVEGAAAVDWTGTHSFSQLGGAAGANF